MIYRKQNVDFEKLDEGLQEFEEIMKSLGTETGYPEVFKHDLNSIFTL